MTNQKRFERIRKIQLWLKTHQGSVATWINAGSAALTFFVVVAYTLVSFLLLGQTKKQTEITERAVAASEMSAKASEQSAQAAIQASCPNVGTDVTLVEFGDESAFDLRIFNEGNSPAHNVKLNWQVVVSPSLLTECNGIFPVQVATLLPHRDRPVKEKFSLAKAEVQEIRNGTNYLFLCGRGAYTEQNGSFTFCSVYRPDFKSFGDCSDLTH